MRVDQIGLNFVRPDVGRPGHHDFLHRGEWLVSQFGEIGVRWNRLAFSWPVIEPEHRRFNWEPYDRIVAACREAGIQVLATLGGHFDRPPVPEWAGGSLSEVIRISPGYFLSFVRAWARHYRDTITHWEILNEPVGQHPDLTVKEYVEGILKPCHDIVKSECPGALVLPCSYHHLPSVGDRTGFWEAARGYYDIHNIHSYVDWGVFRTRPEAAPEEREVRDFLALTEQHGEGDKPVWVTEVGWWGTGNLTADVYEIYKCDPRDRSIEFQPSYRGEEILNHPVVRREDELRAEWLADVYRRLLALPRCEKVFLWTSLDEFDGGYNPERIYGRAIAGKPARQLDLWGIIAGDGQWRKSAFALRDLVASAEPAAAPSRNLLSPPGV
jgi:Glycosyl hydrolase family 1